MKINEILTEEINVNSFRKEIYDGLNAIISKHAAPFWKNSSLLKHLLISAASFLFKTNHYEQYLEKLKANRETAIESIRLDIKEFLEVLIKKYMEPDDRKAALKHDDPLKHMMYQLKDEGRINLPHMVVIPNVLVYVKVKTFDELIKEDSVAGTVSTYKPKGENFTVLVYTIHLIKEKLNYILCGLCNQNDEYYKHILFDLTSTCTHEFIHIVQNSRSLINSETPHKKSFKTKLTTEPNHIYVSKILEITAFAESAAHELIKVAGSAKEAKNVLKNKEKLLDVVDECPSLDKYCSTVYLSEIPNKTKIWNKFMMMVFKFLDQNE